MATPRRPRFPPSSARRREVGGRFAEAQTLLLAQQGAIAALQRDLAAMGTPRRKVLSTAGLDKCDLDMTAADFRTWRRSLEDWIELNAVGNGDAARYIRLLCAPRLQKTLDARFPKAQWDALSTTEALNNVSKLVLRTANQAVQWSDFFSVKQAVGESVSDYFTKCSQMVLDCAFQCPDCDKDLSEYMLVRKLVAGLREPALRREIFQCHGQFTDVDSLRAHCVAFEAAQRDAHGFPPNRPAEAAAGDIPDDDVIAAGVPRKSHHRTCWNCGDRHQPGKKACPAAAATCRACGKLGHFEKVCKGGKKPSTKDSVASAVVAAAGMMRQPRLKVLVSGPEGRAEHSTTAIADTGAQVCVAGPSLLKALGLPPEQLQQRSSLRDLANISLPTLGTATCNFSIPGRSTQQDVYFVRSVQQVYLSLAACKDLGLVHEHFPNPLLPAVASVDEESSGKTASLPVRPASMPLPPLEENVPRLQEWLLGHFSTSTFNTDRYPLPVMAGPPHHIHLSPDATPYACHTPASIPKHWEAEVKQQLDEDVRRGVIRPVPAGEATEWCARMVVVAKKSGKPRRTVDFQKLNACCQRETHHTPAPFDMASGIPVHSYKSVADAHWGFHQVELDEESRRLTTFITPWGRYQYCRTPMGHCAAGDAYTKRFDDAIIDLPRKYKCIDDTLLYDTGVEEAFWHVYDFLEVCAKAGVTLKPEKFRFCHREVDFVGYHLAWDTYKPTEERLTAIRDFQMPEKPSITDVRSWFGFVNQLAPFLATAPLMSPFRDLLKKPAGKTVYWDECLQNKFIQAKEVICQLAKQGLAYYDKTRPTMAITDWCKDGIGFVVMQQYCSCSPNTAPLCCKGGWRLALCGSRHLTSAESGYAPVEGEALAVTWCLRKARLFLLGCPNLVIATDHRPLTKLFGDKALKDISNPRLFRLKERTLQYRFTMRFLPGKHNAAADFLSRYPAARSTPDEVDEDQDVAIAAAMSAATVAALDLSGCVTIDEEIVSQVALEDPTYQMLVSKVNSGDWEPRKSQEPVCLRPFYSVRDRLAVSRGLVTYTYDQGCVRLVIPEALRQRVSASLHASHQGLDSMLRRARQTVYWPGMEGDLQHHRATCDSCNTNAPSQLPEPLLLTPPPEYPFQQTVADIFQLEGQAYLVYADRLTGWLEVAHLPSGAHSGKIMKHLRHFFTRWGAPEQLSTDGGTNLVSGEMTAFLRRWGVTTRISSAHYPQSNGRAEAAVKTAKRILRDNTGPSGSLDNDKVSLALLQYLNTPLREGNMSPAQLTTGRQLRDGVPTAKQNYRVNPEWGEALEERETRLAQHHDEIQLQSAGRRRQRRRLQPGARVWVQDQPTKRWSKSGTVVEVHPHRQYAVRMDGSGRISLRTRSHLKEVPLQQEPPSPCDSPEQQPPEAPQPAPPERERPQRKKSRPRWLADYVD